MPDTEPIDAPRRLDTAERDVLYLLTTPESGQPLWSMEDIGRDIESVDDADIAVRGLHQAGLVNTTSDGFVFATRPAVRLMEMVGHVG